MKLNPLSAALDAAEKKRPILPLPKSPPPPPPPPPPPTFPPIKKVEGGLINRKPVNRQAALVTAPAPWWALAPYTPEPTQGQTLPEVIAQLKRATEHIRKAEQINAKLRAHLKTAKTEAEDQQRKTGAKIEQLEKANLAMTKELEVLRQKLSVAALWEKI